MPVNSTREYDPTSMDAAADAASQELRNLNQEAVRQVALWWSKHYLAAGHKRLGRVLLTTLKQNGG